ncbi:MAG: hypothetical protein N2747_01810 [Chitinophagaceae bacterium]|nr:hypothetical protein [Chitinophagaceae bacterium]
MRKIISVLILMALVLTSCKKGQINGDYRELGIGSYLTRVAIGNIIIDYSNLSNSKVDVTVREYGTPVSKVIVYVTKGSSATTNKSLWKKVKEFPYNGDTKLEITAAELAAALNIPVTGLETGETYTFYNQAVSKDGQVHDITNTGSGFYGNPNYNMLMTWQAVVVCPFNAAAWGGVGAVFSARVLEDGWADYSPGDIISNIEITSPTQLKFNRMWLTDPSDTRPVLVNINAATGAATVPRQIYGDYAAFGISDISCASTGTNNWVFSCVNRITLTLNHMAGTVNYGTYVLRLQKL